jgi:excisionase family DNA binding protein
MQKVFSEKALTLKREADAQRCRLAMNIDQAAAEAGIGRDAIYEGIRAGTLEARKLGRRTIITREALERFIAALPRLQLPADPQGGDAR